LNEIIELELDIGLVIFPTKCFFTLLNASKNLATLGKQSAHKHRVKHRL
jgi:hypothetical protein